MREGDSAADAALTRAVPLLVWGIVLVTLSAALGAWVYAQGNTPFAIDIWWNTLLASNRSPFLTALSLALDFIGGGWFAVFVVPIGGAVVLVAMRRPWSAAYFVVAQAVSAGLVQVLKTTFGRARPEDILIVSDYGSFPSGHVAGAATLATILVVLFPRTWVLYAGIAWVLLMTFARTYLHAHWLSDTLGGALVGTGTALVLAGALASRLARERPARAG